MPQQSPATPVSGSVRGIVRPLRLGFLISPTDASQIGRAISLASLFWGGRYFPFIPAMTRLAKPWRVGAPKFRPSPKELCDGYIDAFDPDVLVNLTGTSFGDRYLGRAVVTSDVLLSEAAQHHRVECGIGLNEVALSFAETELKYARSTPLSLLRTRAQGTSPLFLQALYGHIEPEDWGQLFVNSGIASLFVEQDIALEDLGSLDASAHVTIGRLSCHSVERARRGSRLYSSYLFALDASVPHDIFDFWNLRALGRNVLPLPIQAVSNERWLSQCVDVVENSRRRPERPNGWWGSTLLLKGRSLTTEALDTCVQALALPPTPKDEGPYIHVGTSYPRLWSPLERGWDDAVAFGLESAELSQDFADAREPIRISVPSPSVAAKHVYPEYPRFACELYPSVWVNDGSFAEVVPEGGDKVAGCLGTLPFEDVRLTSRGPVALCRTERASYILRIPLSQDVVTAWLEERGYAATLSGEGRVALAALKQIGGPSGATRLVVPGVLALLADMSAGKHYTHKTIRDGLSAANSGQPTHRDPDWVIRDLASSDVLRLGVEIPCASCGRSAWYSLDSCTYAMECTRCTASLSLRGMGPDELRWAYSPMGAFRADKSLLGALPLLLTLRFAGMVSRGAITPMLSFTLKGNDFDGEVDMCMFYRDDNRLPEWGDGGHELIFCECKFKGPFEDRDFKRMEALRAHFPGAVLCFATLRDGFSDGELRKLRTLAARGRRKGVGERPDTPLLILTQTELTHYLPPPSCWGAADSHRGKHDLAAMCDATTVRYLGLPTWEEERIARIDRRVARSRAQPPRV